MVIVWMMGLMGQARAQAPADPSSQEARIAQAQELYRLGSGLYKAGRYREAIVSFQQAYELSDNKKLLYNIANAQERLGDLEGAIDNLKAYRPHAPVTDVVSLDLRIASLEERLRTGPTDETAPSLPPATEPVAERPRPGPSNRRQPRWAVVGTGAALAAGFGAAGVVTYLQGRDDQAAGERDAYRTNRTLNNIAVPLAGVGAGLAVLGFVLPRERRAVDPGAASVETTRDLTVSVTPTGAGVRLTF